MEHSDSSMIPEKDWKGLLKAGGIMAFAVIGLIPIQMIVFILFPPPETALEFINLFQENWFIGMLSLDLLYIINNTFLIIVYLGLFAALRKTDFSLIVIAITLGLLGIASYFASTVIFEMQIISNRYFMSEEAGNRSQLLAAAETLLANYKGTAFVVYYMLNGATLLLISRIMLKDRTFSRATAIWGLISGLLMLVPSTFGTIGLIFSIASLVPWIVFSVLFGSRLLKLSKES
jgi:hypothetical protein